MKPVKKILNLLNGLRYPQDYLCLAGETFQQGLHVYLVEGHRVILDITENHVFAGYSPLIFVFPGHTDHFKKPPSLIHLIFSPVTYLPNDFFSEKDAIASLNMTFFYQQEIEDNAFVYYEGVSGKHRFQNSFQQFIQSFHNQLYNRKPGNVYLKGNLLKQVQIAYAIPRNISLITLHHDGMYNLFPTDLHGPLDKAYYIISLRHGGKACSQAKSSGQLLISRVHSRIYRLVYSLGKNHMREPVPLKDLPFSPDLSALFHLPLPDSVLSYRELEYETAYVKGIHSIMLFRIRTETILSTEPATLSHLHNSYASWHLDKGRAGNYLLR